MERISKFRATVLLVAFCLLLGLFAFKLYDLQIIKTGGSTDNRATFTTLTRVKAARGAILDRNGNVLVSNRASYDLMINHYVLLTADNTNDNLLRLVRRCQEAGIEYTEHFPVSKEQPYTYTLDQYNATWQSYFQQVITEMGGLDSDISAPLLVETLRQRYRIPDTWTEEEARSVIGLLYEMSLRKYINSLSMYVFLPDASEEELAAIVELNIPGMKVEITTVRQYNTVYAAHILGYVGAMSPAQWEYYKDIPGYEMDAEVGQDGLEAAYEEYLHGVDGWREDTVTTDGTLVSSKWRKEPKAGANVEVSIDLNLQMAGEDRMAAVIEELRAQEAYPDGSFPDGQDARGGAFVALDTKTWQVLACGSYPTFDLNTFFENFEELSKDPYNPLYNRALLETYPPGSTYKMNMIVAGMESGIIDADTKIEDKGRFAVGGMFLHCHQFSGYGDTHGYVDAAKALQVSCNYYFYDVGTKIAIEEMDKTAKALGLGEKTGVELPEYVGYRANPENKALLHRGDDANWYIGDQALAAIGQSDNRFTPIQLCAYTAALANQGNRYKATFMNRVLSSDYSKILTQNKIELLSHLDISDETYAAYSHGMYLVTSTVDGTADTAFMNYPIAVAGKTGTAEIGIEGASDNGAFVCYAPLENPQIAVAVYVERGGHGSTLATIARSILDAYFNLNNQGESDSFENQVS